MFRLLAARPNSAGHQASCARLLALAAAHHERFSLSALEDAFLLRVVLTNRCLEGKLHAVLDLLARVIAASRRLHMPRQFFRGQTQRTSEELNAVHIGKRRHAAAHFVVTSIIFYEWRIQRFRTHDHAGGDELIIAVGGQRRACCPGEQLAFEVLGLVRSDGSQHDV